MEEAAKRHAKQDEWLTNFTKTHKPIERLTTRLSKVLRQRQETDKSRMAEPLEILEITPEIKQHHAEEALVHETMESLKKIKINRPYLKEIRQTDNYAKHMKDLVASKPRTEEDEEIRMNPRCSTLLFSKISYPLRSKIQKVSFSFVPLEGIEKLKPINMAIEMADNTKCTPKGIVENLLIKIDNIIFPIDFAILDMVEDFKMPIILGRPLLATAHTKVDIFRKSISLEVGNEKVIFKMRSSFTTTIFESIRSIRSETCPEDDDFKNIDYDLFLYDYESCKFNRLLGIDPDIFSYDIDIHESYEEIVYRITEVEKETYLTPKEKRVHWFKAILQEKENVHQYWASYDPYSDVCDGGGLPNNEEKHEDDLEGILDYLEPRSYDGLIDLEHEAYNKRKCRSLGSTYKEPPPILIEKFKITRYTIGPEEVYTRVKVLGIDEMPRTRDNVAVIRARLMEKIAKDRSVQAKT
ncbi:zinc knuckle CX2CX4HX4C containing protein [Tanacetum coccineum]